MSESEQDPRIPGVQQDQVGQPAERAEQLRRAASSTEAAEESAPPADGDPDSAEEPAAAPAAPPGVFEREGSSNLTTDQQESGQRDGEWEADAHGTIQHTTGGAEAPVDEDPERPR